VLVRSLPLTPKYKNGFRSSCLPKNGMSFHIILCYPCVKFAYNRRCAQTSSISLRSVASARLLSTASRQPTLKERLAEIIPAAQEKVGTRLATETSLCWHPNIPQLLTSHSHRSRRPVLSMARKLSGLFSSTNSMGVLYRPPRPSLSDHSFATSLAVCVACPL
jgi:hypothetical protein